MNQGGKNCVIALAAVLAAAVSTPALAQTTEFYVVEDVKTKKCTIADKKPMTTAEVTAVGNGVDKTPYRGSDRYEVRQGLHPDQLTILFQSGMTGSPNSSRFAFPRACALTMPHCLLSLA